MSVRATEKLVGELRFVKAPTAYQQSAVADHITLSATLHRQQTYAARVCLHGLLREAPFGVSERERRATLVLTKQLEIPHRVLWAAQPESQPFGFDGERHWSVAPRHIQPDRSSGRWHTARPE